MKDYLKVNKEPFNGVRAGPIVALCIKASYHNLGWTNDTKIEEVIHADPGFVDILHSVYCYLFWLGIEDQVITANDISNAIWSQDYQLTSPFMH